MLNLDKIENLLSLEPKFRLSQANKAIFQDLIDDWLKVTTLPMNLRQTLNNKALLDILAETQKTVDNKTIKALISLDDDLKIETVLMRYSRRNTVCVSSQVGCPLNCLFCATGQMGFKRNLSVSEIVGQIIFFARYLKKENQKITNIVFMGMGEPFLNYDNVLTAIKLLNDPEKMGLGARRFSISTCGIVEGINKLANEPREINLAISLHAANNQLRSKLMPINQKYPLDRLMNAVRDYVIKTKRKVMFEYVLLNGINDSREQARELAYLMRNPLYHVNLIEYNVTSGFYKPSKREKVNAFKQVLKERGVSFTERQSLGREIKGACGQLTAAESGRIKTK
jgi:23S rRNA (adenine2503-C2)-methyltransferase